MSDNNIKAETRDSSHSHQPGQSDHNQHEHMEEHVDRKTQDGGHDIDHSEMDHKTMDHGNHGKHDIGHSSHHAMMIEDFKKRLSL